MTHEFDLSNELSRLARFGANITDAHGCYLFLPLEIIDELQSPHTTNAQSKSKKRSAVALIGYHSLSSGVKPAEIELGSGLVGWVAKHGRMIHVSPFEHDSKTLGFYTIDQELKSFIGVPVSLNLGRAPATELYGVIACDSKKSYAFSKLQGKLIEDLADSVASTVRLAQHCVLKAPKARAWSDFIAEAQGLSRTVGAHSIDTFRIRFTNIPEAEQRLGTAELVKLYDQVVRLIGQAIPQQHPSFKLPNGDLIVVLDAMVSSLYRNKIQAICERISMNNVQLQIVCDVDQPIEYASETKSMNQGLSLFKRRLEYHRLETEIQETDEYR